MKDGGPAYPVTAKDADYNFMGRDCEGLSIRDYFAGKAMTFFVTQSDAEECARLSYEYADAMIREKSKARDS